MVTLWSLDIVRRTTKFYILGFFIAFPQKTQKLEERGKNFNNCLNFIFCEDEIWIKMANHFWNLSFRSFKRFIPDFWSKGRPIYIVSGLIYLSLVVIYLLQLSRFCLVMALYSNRFIFFFWMNLLICRKKHHLLLLPSFKVFCFTARMPAFVCVCVQLNCFVPWSTLSPHLYKAFTVHQF